MLNDRGMSALSYSIIAAGHRGKGNLDVNPQLGPLAEDERLTPNPFSYKN